jgi:hypothetical protein
MSLFPLISSFEEASNGRNEKQKFQHEQVHSALAALQSAPFQHHGRMMWWVIS